MIDIIKYAGFANIDSDDKSNIPLIIIQAISPNPNKNFKVARIIDFNFISCTLLANV